MNNFFSLLTISILSSTLTFNVALAECGPDQYSRQTFASHFHRSLGGGETGSSSVKETSKTEKNDTVTYSYTVNGSNANAVYKMTFLCERNAGANFMGAYLKSTNVISWQPNWD